MGPILVFGHRNPDNDSLCSAVAYAHLKNRTDASAVYVPARLGPVPPESAWVFERFAVDLPDEIDHVHTRVRDAMTTDVFTVRPEQDMLSAGRLMRERRVRALPVVGDDGSVRGLVNDRILAERYIDETAVVGFSELPVTVGQLVATLGGRLLAGDASTVLSGGVAIGAMEPETMLGYLKPGDTLIVGDRRRTQPMALEAGVACLVVTGGREPEPDVLEIAERTGAAVVSAPHDTYATARLVNLSHAVGAVMDTTVLQVHPDTLLADATEDLVDSPHREVLVTDEEGALAGILTRTNLARGLRRRVILVDHNELAQSAPGVENAEVVEIVDHHRVGDVQTAAPILFLNLPVGSTATIVAERYRELDVDVPEQMAGLLLSAVLSDTVLLKSPTTTPTDVDVAERLASIARVDVESFGMEMFRARSATVAFSTERTVESDLKEYRLGDALVAVGQVETVDAGSVLEHRDALLGHMAALAEARRYDLLMLLVTDVVREGSEVLAVGKTRIAERALGIDLSGGSAWMDGVLSRKKQIAARLVEASGTDR
ncbi:MAG: putative manganese-dependent inorganic diphosphatase [Anaerosomatales bacterium]|nr:putative manganese-dependent inorganic diphosphatase [Anaerosomatales bacterium]